VTRARCRAGVNSRSGKAPIMRSRFSERVPADYRGLIVHRRAIKSSGALLRTRFARFFAVVNKRHDALTSTGLNSLKSGSSPNLAAWANWLPQLWIVRISGHAFA